MGGEQPIGHHDDRPVASAITFVSCPPNVTIETTAIAAERLQLRAATREPEPDERVLVLAADAAVTAVYEREPGPIEQSAR